MLAVSVKNFEIAEIMFTVCLTSAYDFVIKATRLSKDVGGFLTPFLLDGFQDILRTQSSCVFERDIVMKENTVEKEGKRDRRRRQSKRRRVEGAVAESISAVENALDSTVDDNSSNVKDCVIAKFGPRESPRFRHWFHTSALPAYSRFVAEYKEVIDEYREKPKDDTDDTAMRTGKESVLLEWERDMEILVLRLRGTILESHHLNRCWK